MRPVTYLDSPEMRQEVLTAVKSLAEIVGKTLGPGGRPILLQQEGRPPLSTKDGVTVAKHYSAPNPLQAVVSEAAVEVCERTVRQVGDGTTTAIVLASAIVEAGQEWLQENKKYSPQRLSRELKELFGQTIKPMILGMARPIKDMTIEEASKAVRHVAMVSANHDEEIANAVAEAIKYVGEDGMVVAEEGTGAETRVEHKEGFPINSGLSDLGGSASAAFVNRKNYGDCVIEYSYVAMYDGEINDVETILPILQRVDGEVDEHGRAVRHPMILVAHRFGDQVLKVLSQNFRQNRLTVIPMVTPRNGQANGKQAFLYDLQAYVGGNVFDSQGNPLQNAFPSMLGQVEYVRIGLHESVFMTAPDLEAVEDRIAALKEQMEGASEFDKDKYRYRISQLTGGVATIYAGGATALEAKERHARVVDAVSAVRSAMDFGVVPGGGTTLLHVSRMLPSQGPSQILAKALKRPFIQILINAGVASNPEEALFIGNEAGQREDGTFVVYDALKREAVEFWSSGIFDPAKVSLSALENSLSVAQLLMTLGGVVSMSFSEGEQQVKAMQEGLVKAINNGELE
jgi:chaperonin GroEL